MSEPSINLRVPEAQQLYMRGVAAAKGGQKRVAAGLLTRSVQLNPNNEAAWLWLSGVLEDPHQVAFCLQSVLRLNPANERAQKGMRWLEDRKVLTAAPRPIAALEPAQGAEPTRAPVPQTQAQAQAQAQREAWWQPFRSRRREDNRLRLVLPAVMIMLLALILVLHQSIAQANDTRQRALLVAAAPKPTAVPATPTAVPPPTVIPAILDAEPATLRDATSTYYISTLTPLRKELRDAVDSYRNISGQPGATSVLLASSVRSLRDRVVRAQSILKNMQPSTPLRPAHEEYLKGLEIELLALDDLLEFYGSYRQELANRAALRFQEANSHFDLARQTFDLQPRRTETANQVSPHTPR
jgi:hypothetical protein